MKVVWSEMAEVEDGIIEEGSDGRREKLDDEVPSPLLLDGNAVWRSIVVKDCDA